MRMSDWSSDVCSSDLPRELSAANPPKPHPLGRQRLRVHAPHAATEADTRNVGMLERATCKVVEAGSPKPATIGVEWPPDVAEDETKIGRASCRERVGQYVEISGVAGSLKKKTT